MDARVLNDAIGLLQPDRARTELATARHAAIWHNWDTDYLPFCFGTDVPEQKQLGLEFDMVAEFNEPDVMLWKALWGMIGVARSGSDSIPSVRPNLGTGFVATMFGLEPTVMPHTLPWLKQHLTKQQIERFSVPGDVSQLGLMPRAIELLRFFRQKLGSRAGTFLADTQSPFDLAHLVRGDDVFTDIYDDPPFLHHLLGLTTEMYIKASTLMKQASGEPLNAGCHGNFLWMDGGGVRACEDSSTLLPPAAVDEFVIPYLQKALDPFGGGWVHYCGNNARLLNALIDDAPAVRGINFGNPERHDHATLLPRLVATGKFYVGMWPRNADEDIPAYFARILRPLGGARRGLMLQSVLDTSTPEKARAAMEMWHEAQDRA